MSKISAQEAISGQLGTIYTANPSLNSCVIDLPIMGDWISPWIVSDYNQDGYTMIMSMANLCQLTGNPAGCDTL